MSVVVETKEGSLQGVSEDGLEVFRGIPFAAPPTGERRFRPPAPAEPWNGVRVCDTFGRVAPQPAGQAMAGQGTAEEQDEDCLYLNVTTPRRAGTGGLGNFGLMDQQAALRWVRD